MREQIHFNAAHVLDAYFLENNNHTNQVMEYACYFSPLLKKC